MRKSLFRRRNSIFSCRFSTFCTKNSKFRFFFSIIRKKARFVALFSFFAGFPLSAKRSVRRTCDIFREVAWGLVKRAVFASFPFSSCYFLHFQALSARAAFRAFGFSSFYIYSSVVTFCFIRNIGIKQRQNLRFCRVTTRENDDRQKVSFCRKKTVSVAFPVSFSQKRQGTFPFFRKIGIDFVAFFVNHVKSDGSVKSIFANLHKVEFF